MLDVNRLVTAHTQGDCIVLYTLNVSIQIPSDRMYQTIFLVYSLLYSGVILGSWALMCDMETNNENIPIKSKNLPNNIRMHVPKKVCILFICQR